MSEERAAVGGSREHGGNAGSPDFATLAPSGGVPFDRLLLALAAEFHPVDTVAALQQLDDLARPLFGVARPDAHCTAQRIAATLSLEGDIRPSKSLDGLFLDRVLGERRGDPALLAALSLETARRAGVSLCLLSAGRRWLVGLIEGYRLVTIDPVSSDVRRWRDPLAVRAHCAHELADAVLAELSTRFRSDGREREARHAVELRLLLPHREERRS